MAVLLRYFLKFSSKTLANYFFRSSAIFSVWVIVTAGKMRFLLSLGPLKELLFMTGLKMPRLVRQLA